MTAHCEDDAIKTNFSASLDELCVGVKEFRHLVEEKEFICCISALDLPHLKSTQLVFEALWKRMKGIASSPSDPTVARTGAELGPVLRDAARAPLRVLRLPLSGGNGRLATLRPAVGAAADLRVRHRHPLEGRHRQPPAG